MKKSNDFYKVVNAVINTLNHGDSVAYVSGGNGGSGFGIFSPNEDFNDIRNSLLSFDDCEELENEEILADFDNEFVGDKGDYVFWQLKEYGTQNPPIIQLAIVEDYYCDSGTLAEMIADEQDLEAAEITTGMNGYPRGLRGCVLLSGCGKTIDEMKELADLYGVELVSLHRRDGWRLWECEGTTFDLYDYADYMDNHNDNLHRWDSYKDYADELREYAADMDDEELKQQFTDAADKVADWQLEPNEFIYCEQGYPYLTDPDKADRMVDHFSYDTHQYTLALDCRIDE